MLFDILKFLTKKKSIQLDFLKLPDSESRFNHIFKENYWSGEESVSGNGSSLRATENIRSALPLLAKKYNIQTLFDAPCGDFNWMQHFVNVAELNYIGGDIVGPLIERNQHQYTTNSTNFLKFDITRDKFPEADLWLCRHCLFHLSFQDIHDALVGFLASSIPLMLTTTNTLCGEIPNKDITTGDFRLIDLYSEPFNFPREVLFKTPDFVPPDPPMDICLWNREQISEGISHLQEYLSQNNSG
jgi:hypothetical protein